MDQSPRTACLAARAPPRVAELHDLLATLAPEHPRYDLPKPPLEGFCPLVLLTKQSPEARVKVEGPRPAFLVLRGAGFESQNAVTQVHLGPRQGANLANAEPGDARELDRGGKVGWECVQNAPQLSGREEALPHIAYSD